MDKDMKKDVERLSQASRLVKEEQLHGDNIAGIVEINERTEDTNELITKLIKKLKLWKGVLITGIVVFILILLYMLFTGVVHKEPTLVAPDYKESDPNISTEVTEITETVEPKDEKIRWYYVNEAPDIDVANIETSTVHGIYNQGFDIQYFGCKTDREDNEMLYDGADSYVPLNLGAIADDKVYMVDSLKNQYESTKRTYKKIDDAIAYDPNVPQQDTLFNGALSDGIPTFEFYNEATLQDNSSTPSYFESSLAIIVYDNIDDSEIQSGVEAVLDSYNNKEMFYLGDTDVFDKAVEQFSYLGDKVKVSYTSRDNKVTDNEAPADTKVTKTYIVNIYDSMASVQTLAKVNHWY